MAELMILLTMFPKHELNNQRNSRNSKMGRLKNQTTALEKILGFFQDGATIAAELRAEDCQNLSVPESLSLF